MGTPNWLCIESGTFSKQVFDLKISGTGVKRWIIKYVTKRYRCVRCKRSFYSEDYPTKQPRIGRNLASWAVYQHVALRQSFADVALSINDIFGYSFCRMIGERAQTRLAEVYRVTVDKMLNLLRSGMLIHADETKVKLKHSSVGYVWAFTARRSSSISIIRPGKEPSSRRRLVTSLASSSRTSTLRMIRSPATSRSAIST